MRAITLLILTLCASAAAGVLDPEAFQHYPERFHAAYAEEVVNAIPDAAAWEWMKNNVPLLSVPDKEIEATYYYRWWTFRKHIKQAGGGYVITEFLKPVKHGGEHNAISCALGHHIAEGRWLHDRKYLEADMRFWLQSGPDGGLQKNYHAFSNWTASAAWDKWLVDGDRQFLLSLLDPLQLDYKTWERDRLVANGMFWQRDVSDGMEDSISGGRKVRNLRPTINSYMYGNAKALAAMATLAGKKEIAAEYEKKAAELKRLVQEQLWEPKAGFFETRLESGGLADVRELIGYTPWLFDLPDDKAEYGAAWQQLREEQGFQAPYGPTTAERRAPGFRIAESGDDCQWNGPSWPFSTTVTLKALANLLNDYRRHPLSREDYPKLLSIYARSQRLKLADGQVVPFVDENLNPLTGEWHARARKIKKGTFYGRGDHYNHSGFADLVITGLIGLRPRSDGVVEVNPLVPESAWDWFCLDKVPYHGKTLTIIWDKSGRHFGRGKGLRILVDGREVARSARLGRLTGELSGRGQ